MRYTRRQIGLYHRQAMALEGMARADRIEDISAAFSNDAPRLVKILRSPD